MLRRTSAVRWVTILGLVAGSVLAGSVLGASAGAGFEEIRVFESYTDEFVELDHGRRGESFGDSVMWRDSLLDAAKDRQVGHIYAECVRQYTNDWCSGVIVLAGRGQLIFEGVTSRSEEAHVRRFAITGGTGPFIGAAGEFVSDNTTGDDTGLFFTIRLVQ